MVDAVGSVAQLHKLVLSWDYWDLWDRAEEGKGVFDELQPVPKTFKDVNEYKETFGPMILEECAAQILRGVDEGEVLNPHPTLTTAHEQRGEFLVVRFLVSQGQSEDFSDNDLVLISKGNPQLEDAPKELHALGFLEAHEGAQFLRVKFFLTDESQAGNASGTNRVRAMRHGLETPKSCWWLQKLSNMSTITREWIALQHAQLMPFTDILISGMPRSAPASKHLDIPIGMRAAMERECNASQMSALQAGLDGTPLVLIQGPPGTGKTRTILNLLSVIMHSASKSSVEFLAAQAAARKAAQAEGTSESGAAGQEAAAGALLLGDEDRLRLWLRQTPWLDGPKDIGSADPLERASGCPRQRIMPSAEADAMLALADALEATVAGAASSGRPLLPPGLKPEDVEPTSLTLPEPAARVGLDHCFGLLRRTAPHKLDRQGGTKARVLVCAPSNSALDEIAIRIMKSGLMDKDGNSFAPSIVRVGVRPHHSVRSVSLEAIIEARLGGEGNKSMSGMERDRMRIAILDEASVVLSTLSFAGSSVFYRLSRKFDVVVIDEAAQSVEPSLLVPLVMGCKQVYLVGDPKQLPATVLSSVAKDANYEQSLFRRMQECGYPVTMLNVQYRMHPAISAFPSQQFYQGGLLDGESVAAGTASPWHNHSCFGPFAFFDVAGKESTPEGGCSIMNKAEANMVLVLYRELVAAHPHLRRSPSVAVISPYKAQVKLLRDAFTKALGEEGAQMVDINTIDGFQGREKDICIFSCVRSLNKKGRQKSHHNPGNIGFVADDRRINVGLTRARCSLLVIGNMRALQVDGNWAALIYTAMQQGVMFRPKVPYADWLSRVLAGAAGPVVASEAELDTLNEIRSRVSSVKTVKEQQEVLGQLAGEVTEEEADEGIVADVVAEEAENQDTEAARAAAAAEEARLLAEAGTVVKQDGDTDKAASAAGGKRKGAPTTTATDPTQAAGTSSPPPAAAAGKATKKGRKG